MSSPMRLSMQPQSQCLFSGSWWMSTRGSSSGKGRRLGLDAALGLVETSLVRRSSSSSITRRSAKASSSKSKPCTPAYCSLLIAVQPTKPQSHHAPESSSYWHVCWQTHRHDVAEHGQSLLSPELKPCRALLAYPWVQQRARFYPRESSHHRFGKLSELLDLV